MLEFDSVYTIRKSWLERLGGNVDKYYDSVYSISLSILEAYGGDITKYYDSVYSIDKEILGILGGDITKCYDSVYSIDKEILTLLGGDMSRCYDSVFSLDMEIIENLRPPVPMATAIFDIDGAIGEVPKSITVEQGSTIVLPFAQFEKEGYDFTYWNDGKNNYSEGDEYILNENVTFKAQYKEKPIMVTATFNINGGVGEIPQPITVEQGNTITLPIAQFEKEGYDFVHWSDGVGNYNEGDEYILNNNVEFIAQYEEAAAFDGLTFMALEDSTIKYTPSTTATAQYSFDANTWENASGVTIDLPTGQKVYFKGSITGNQSSSSGKYAQFSMTGKVKASGNINSMDYNGAYVDGVLRYTYTYYYLFKDCISLVSAPELPATTLANYCYSSMFNGCTSLVSAPELPATTLVNSCYYNMFRGCTELVNIPELSAITLATYCYYGMFYGCTSLVEAPTLPATTLVANCYASMFRDCTSLVSAPELPATTLANYCYQDIFRGCTSLVSAPTTLPATTLVTFGYANMFYGCTSLVEAPTLPATTLASSCYKSMFYGCTSLTTAPELNATTLVANCYQSMFNGCTSLTTAPKLLAKTLVNYCYDTMFKGCSKLNNIYNLCESLLSSNVSASWVEGVASSGTYTKSSKNTSTQRSVNMIPSGWTIVTV